MTPKERKAAMILNDVKVIDLADALGVTPSCVYLVRMGKGKSRRVEDAMAKACRMSHSEMFPENCSAA